MKQLKKYSQHLIGYSILVWLPGFYFFYSESLIGLLLSPLAAIMVSLGIIGWISKPRSKFVRTGYASKFDMFLGWLWNKFAPKWFTFWLFLGIISSNNIAYSYIKNRYRIQREYYDSGELLKEYEVRNGKRNGYFKYFNKDGTLRLEYLNKDNLKHGELTQYYKTGEVESKGYLENGEPIWSELYDNNGMKLNHSEGNQATYFQYFSNRQLSSIDFKTHVYDPTNKDSLLYIQSDSGYFYTLNPHKKALRYIKSNEQFVVQNMLLPNSPFDTVSNWKELKKIKRVIRGKDTLDQGYIPTIHKKKGKRQLNYN